MFFDEIRTLEKIKIANVDAANSLKSKINKNLELSSFKEPSQLFYWFNIFNEFKI